MFYQGRNNSQTYKGNIYIFYMLYVMRQVGTFLGLYKGGEESEINYGELWSKMKELCSSGSKVVLFDLLRDLIEDFIISDNVEKLSQNIFALLNPGEAFEDADPEYIKTLNLKMLSDSLLFKYFVMITGTINLVQKDNLLLVKYSKTIFNTGWHNAALYSRGKVIDLNTMEIVAYPFDKFFNLEEIKENSMENILKKMDESDLITVTEKKDGSLIIVTRLHDGEEPLINTNGSLDNDHIKLARNYLKNKYGFFYEKMPTGYTFMFEMISPEDVHLIKYFGEERLYLLAIRNLQDFSLVPYKTLENAALGYKLDLIPQCEFTSLKDMVEETKKTGINKEGWVFRLSKDEDDYLFKLKYQEYFALHRLSSGVSIIKVYKMLMGGMITEFIENAPSDIQEAILSTLEEIEITKSKGNEIAAMKAEEAVKNAGFTLEDFSEENMEINKQQKVQFIVKTLKSDKLFGPKMVDYIKKPYKRNSLFDRVYTNSFKMLFEYINPKEAK